MTTRLIVSIALLVCGSALAQDVEKRADEILSSSNRADGLCVLVKVPDPALAIAIAERSRFVIQILHDDADTVAAMRKAIDDRDLYGRVSVCESALSSGRLPYAENLVNLLRSPSLSKSTKLVPQVISASVPAPAPVACVTSASDPSPRFR